MNRSTPLQLTWTRDPVKILGIHFSYDEKQNNQYNFAIKIQTLQTNLDLWKSRNLTLFGKVLIIKSLGLSQLVHSASNLNVPIDFVNDTRKKLFSFLWKNKTDKIKRECLYQDYGKGGIRMPNLDLMLKAWLFGPHSACSLIKPNLFASFRSTASRKSCAASVLALKKFS